MAYDSVAGVKTVRGSGLAVGAGGLAPFPSPDIVFLPDSDERLDPVERHDPDARVLRDDNRLHEIPSVAPAIAVAEGSVAGADTNVGAEGSHPVEVGSTAPSIPEASLPTDPLRSGGFSFRGVRQRVALPLAAAVGAPAVGALTGIGIAVIDTDMVAAAVAATVFGVGLGVAGGLSTWRRLRVEVDEPARVLQDAAARIGAGEPLIRSGRTPLGVLAPVVVALDQAGGSVSRRTERLVRQAEWGEASRRIFEAMEFADDEAEAYAVVADALALTDAQRQTELLVSQRGGHRLNVVAENPHAGSPGCPVESTEGCVAIRRGQVLVTDSSESINACPKLRGRDGGACSAVCVPVGVAGQTVGVIHATGPDRIAPDVELVDRLSTLARQVGTRLGSLRALERSREEAATDGLTGLPNRRVLEAQLEQLLESGVEFVAVLGDLDRFKVLNDTYGHEAGDRALQLFARVMQENVRGHDLVARVGGEEFVVVYPDMSVLRSIEAIERLRTALSSAVAVSGVQPFTCSYGVTHSSVGSSVLEILRVADAGLLRAKDLGGDQVVYADAALAAEVFGHGEALPTNGANSRR